MGNMLKMTGLDLRTVAPYWKQYALLTALPFGLGFMDNMGSFLAPFSIVYLLTLAGNVFSAQEKYQLDKLYGSLSLENADIVGGRFFFYLLHLLLGTIVGFAATLVSSALHGNPSSLANIGSTTATTAIASMLYVAIQLPIFFRVPYTKARVATLFPILVLVLAMPLITSIIPGAEEALDALLANASTNPVPVLLLSLAGGVAVLAVSYILSMKMRRAAQA
jgi:hypothetical protein